MRLNAFRISENCPLPDQTTVKRNWIIFLVFGLIFLVSTPLFLYALVAGSETTLIIRNDETLPLVDIRIGHILDEEEYPAEPYAFSVNQTNGKVIYAGRENITEAHISILGFFVTDARGLALLYANRSLLISLFVLFAIGTFNGIVSQTSSLFLPLEFLKANIASYNFLQNNSVLSYIGNLPTGASNHDVRLKVSAGSYIIPIAGVTMTVENETTGYDKTQSVLGGWSETFLNNTIDAKTTHGLWDIRITQINWDYETQYAYTTNDIESLTHATNQTTPLTVDLEITRSFDFPTLFTPVIEYST